MLNWFQGLGAAQWPGDLSTPQPIWRKPSECAQPGGTGVSAASQQLRQPYSLRFLQFLLPSVSSSWVKTKSWVLNSTLLPFFALLTQRSLHYSPPGPFYCQNQGTQNFHFWKKHHWCREPSKTREILSQGLYRVSFGSSLSFLQMLLICTCRELVVSPPWCFYFNKTKTSLHLVFFTDILKYFLQRNKFLWLHFHDLYFFILCFCSSFTGFPPWPPSLSLPSLPSPHRELPFCFYGIHMHPVNPAGPSLLLTSSFPSQFLFYLHAPSTHL